MEKNLFATLILGFLCQVTLAQSFDKAKLDSYFDALETNNKFMGSVAVSKDGKIIYERSLGFIDFENKIKADANSKYRIGSISKTFTAVLVFKAVEANLLDLNQTIASYFPSIKNTEKITLKHLLSHRSGIHNFTDDPDYLTWNTRAKTEKEMLAIIADAGSDFEPDSKAQYSNSNYVLLTYILEKSFKKSYPELLKGYITKPLGLKNTYFGSNINTANNECFSYTMGENWQLAPETDMSVPVGAGGIISTPTDLVTFSDALFGGKLVKPESLALMKTLNDQYGMGLFQFPFYDNKGYGHTGGIDGFSSVFTHFPDGNISYALTSNGTNINNNNISIAVLSAVYNKTYDIPDFVSFNVSEEALDHYVGTYVSEQVPLKITVSKNKLTLIAQATGQAAFPLEATAKDKFTFDQAGIEMEFNPGEGTMLLKQGGAQFNFKKE